MAKEVKIGKIAIGGDNPVAIQSMISVPSTDIEGSVKQAVELEKAGCEILRAAIPDMAAVELIPAIKEKIDIPLVADIHFDYRLALAAVENAEVNGDYRKDKEQTFIIRFLNSIGNGFGNPNRSGKLAYSEFAAYDISKGIPDKLYQRPGPAERIAYSSENVGFFAINAEIQNYGFHSVYFLGVENNFVNVNLFSSAENIH